MKMPLRFHAFMAAAIFVLSAVAAQNGRAALMSYQWNNNVSPPNYDPTTQGWSAGGLGSFVNSVADSAVTISNPTVEQGILVQQSSNTNLAGKIWDLRAEVRTDLSAGTLWEVHMGVDTGVRWWNIIFTSDGTVATDAIYTRSPFTNIGTANLDGAFHVFELIGSGTTTAPELYIDGVATGQFALDGGHFLGTAVQTTVSWGRAGGTGTSTSNWRSVTLEIPEPASLGLLAVGGSITMVRRHSRRC